MNDCPACGKEMVWKYLEKAICQNPECKNYVVHPSVIKDQQRGLAK
jgi:ssDNA-binding Zn-finger/Zn-ribbon topoisomerase 1